VARAVCREAEGGSGKWGVGSEVLGLGLGRDGEGDVMVMLREGFAYALGLWRGRRVRESSLSRLNPVSCNRIARERCVLSRSKGL
jgi:hypothetical protein